MGEKEASAILRLEGAERSYRVGEVTVRALAGVDLVVRRGEFLVIVGPSGSGKSTLLNLVGGMDRASSGRVLHEGRDLSRASEAALTRYRRETVGFVFQFYNLIPALTALENVEVAAEIARDPLDPMEALRLVELEDRARHFPSQLSGGQQQRVAIARALVSRPVLLLCDEPTGALDLEMSRQVLGLLDRVRRESGVTVLLITHNGAIEAIADRVARISDGRIQSLVENPRPLTAAELSW